MTVHRNDRKKTKNPLDQVYFKETFQDTPFGEHEQDVLLGYWEKPEDRIPFRIPDAPKEKSDYLNYDLPKRQQKWIREEPPKDWEPKELAKKGTELFGKKANEPGNEWWADPERRTPKMQRYVEIQTHRRIYGCWLMINGTPTYITGFHYQYLQAFSIDTGYPEYRDRDRRWFYAWQACYDDVNCYGMFYIKHRRDGATYRMLSIALDIATYQKGAKVALQSVSKKHADARIFQEKLAPAYIRYPIFQRPISRTGLKPRDKYDFDVMSRRGKDMWENHIEGMESSIYTVETSPDGHGVSIDGGKVHFYGRDESGKSSPDNINRTWRLVKPAMLNDGIPTKSLFPTTVEESTSKDFDGEAVDNCKVMYDDCRRHLAFVHEMVRETPDGKYAYFTPAWDGTDDTWIGEYGECIIGKPTPEQVEYLKKKQDGLLWKRYQQYYEKGGSYEYLNEQRDYIRQTNPENLQDFKRKYPFTPREAFAPPSESTVFDSASMQNAVDELEEDLRPNVKLHDDLTMAGNFEWIETDEEGRPVLKSDVRFVPNKKGRFLLNRKYILPHKEPNEHGHIANRVKRGEPRYGKDEKYGRVTPYDDYTHVIGMDPFALDKDQTSSPEHGLSSAGMLGFLKFDPSIDGPWIENENGVEGGENFYSHSFVFMYLCRPDFTSIQCEDALKATIYFGARILIERPRGSVNEYFIEHGCGALCIAMPSGGFLDKKRKMVLGIFPDDVAKQRGADKVAHYIKNFPYAHKNPFLRLWQQWQKYTPKKMTLLDLAAASLWTMTAANPRLTQNIKENHDIARRNMAKAKSGVTLYTARSQY